ncbi:methyl-accepting chemotaxis protein [Rhodoferax sp. GW822-FHT02A01]|uniref:methyl-accepting chemotaxis protein n=1 Tax=Rhodoferax sp. GW822-FHT02A01 TaxID=3141537 RepID=UPI00315DB5A9
MQLNRFRIGSRLIFGFGLVLLLSLSMGLLALFELMQVNQATKLIAASNLPSVALAGRLQESISEIRLLENRHVLTFDADEKDDLDKVIGAAQQRFSGYFNSYDKRELPADERAAFEDFRRALKAYEETQPKLIELSKRGMTELPLSRTFLIGDSQKAYAAASAALTKLVALNEAASATSFEASQSTFRHSTQLVVGILVALLAFGALLAIRITRSIVRPVQKVQQAAEGIAHGDLSANLVLEGSDEMADLMQAVSKMQTALHHSIAQVANVAQSVQSASSEIASGNQDLSHRTEHATANLEKVASHMGTLTQTVQHSARSAVEANQLAVSAAQVAGRGGEVMDQVIETMQLIDASSRRIADIIGVIDGIAFQTNILALNAAVEAARAGEQGRGFAVVASEVRSLAGRSADAAKEIRSLILASEAHVKKGSGLVSHAGQTMLEINASVQQVSTIIGQISTADSAQSEGIAQVGTAISELDHLTHQNSALVEESAAAAKGLSDEAQRLSRTIAVFNLGDAGAGLARLPLAEVDRT